MSNGSEAEQSGPRHLNHRHRSVLTTLLDHEGGHNLRWKETESLLHATGTIEQRHDGRLAVTIGDETEIFDRTRDHHVDRQQLVDLRRMLTNAGYTAGGPNPGD